MITAKDIMQEVVPWINIKSTAKDALNVLSGGKKCLVVLEGEAAVGVISDNEILGSIAMLDKVDFNKLNVKKIMSHKFVFVEESAKMDEINDIMKDKDINYIIVGQGVGLKDGHSMSHIKGIITHHDILEQTGKIYESNLRFRRYQDIQTFIITLFFAFLIAWLVYSKYFA